MNYQTNIKQTYNLDLDVFSSGYGAYALMESGNSYYVALPSGQSMYFDDLSYYIVNTAHRHYNLQDTCLMYLVNTPYNLTLCASTKVDYVVSHSLNGQIISGRVVSQQGSYYEVGDGSALSNYPQYNPNTSVSGYSYGQYSIYFDDDYSIYDFSSVQGVTISTFKQDSLYLRGENIAYYHTELSYIDVSANSLQISYGSPYYDYGNSEYERGYGNGYSGGSYDGYQIGYNDGLTIGGVDTNSATAFSYLGGAFNAVQGIMSLEVLPNITLGLIWTIPVVIGIITLLFRLVRK